MMIRTYKIAIISAIVLSTSLISIDGKSYWHEIRFTYAVSNYDLGQILSGVFNPHQLGAEINQVSAGGFYLSKILHLAILRSIFLAVDSNDIAFKACIVISELFIALMALVVFYLFKELLPDKNHKYFAVAAFMLTPLTPYLSGKILSEVPGLLFVGISILSQLKYNTKRNEKKYYLLIISSLFLLLTMMSRLDMILIFIGLQIALLLTQTEEKIGIRYLKTGIIVFLLSGVVYLTFLCIVKPGITGLYEYFIAFYYANSKPVLMSISSIILSMGPMLVIGLVSIFSKNRKEFMLFFMWLILSVFPIAYISSSYMIEPRYLVNGLLPFIGLSVLGIDAINIWIKNKTYRRNILAISICFILLLNIIIIRLMPYEIDRYAIKKAYNATIENDPEGVILIPWAYTDYHYLSMIYNNKNILNVNSIVRNGEVIKLSKQWKSKLRELYGDRWLHNSDKLKKIINNKPVFYMGWTVYPPFQFANQILRYLGLIKIKKKIDKISLMNHLTQSWLWNKKDYLFEPVRSVGIYRIFKVKKVVK